MALCAYVASVQDRKIRYVEKSKKDENGTFPYTWLEYMWIYVAYYFECCFAISHLRAIRFASMQR